jgi:hypothetical protein
MDTRFYDIFWEEEVTVLVAIGFFEQGVMEAVQSQLVF